MLTPSQPMIPVPDASHTSLPPAVPPGAPPLPPAAAASRRRSTDTQWQETPVQQRSIAALLRAERDRAARHAIAVGPDHRPSVVVLPGDGDSPPMVTHSVDGAPLDEWVVDNLRLAHRFGRAFGDRYPGLRVPAAKVAARFLDCVYVVLGDAPLTEFPLEGFMSNLSDFAHEPALELARGTILGEFFRWLQEHNKISERTAGSLLARLGRVDPLVLLTLDA